MGYNRKTKFMNTSSQYLEQIFFHYILANQSFLNVAKSEFFSSSVLKDLFEIAKEHASRYKEAPSKEQLTELIHIKGVHDKYNDDIISALYNTKALLSQYDGEWLTNNVGPWIEIRNLDTVMRSALAYMKLTKSSAENAHEIVEKVRNMISTGTSIDFKFNLGRDFFDPTSHMQTRLERHSSGYDYVDLCLKGGYWRGALLVLLGMPKIGKSMWLTNLAAKSIQQGHNTAYVTLELQEEIVYQRIGSNLLNVSMDDYLELVKDQTLLKQKLNKLKEDSLINIGNLHVKEFPASTASANDIEAYLLKAEELLGYKFENVFIDYLNIMKNWRNPNTENLYLKIKQIAEDVRAMAQRNGWCIISVSQVNRGGWNSSDMQLTSISESAGLLHTVDVMFGIISDPEMKARGEYFLKCLADRVAGYENTKKRYTVDWKYSRIEEDRYSKIEDMDFVVNSVIANQKYARGSNNQTKPSPYSIPGTKENNKVDDDIIKATTLNITGEGLF